MPASDPFEKIMQLTIALNATTTVSARDAARAALNAELTLVQATAAAGSISSDVKVRIANADALVKATADATVRSDLRELQRNEIHDRIEELAERTFRVAVGDKLVRDYTAATAFADGDMVIKEVIEFLREEHKNARALPPALASAGLDAAGVAEYERYRRADSDASKAYTKKIDDATATLRAARANAELSRDAARSALPPWFHIVADPKTVFTNREKNVLNAAKTSGARALAGDMLCERIRQEAVRNRASLVAPRYPTVISISRMRRTEGFMIPDFSTLIMEFLVRGNAYAPSLGSAKSEEA